MDNRKRLLGKLLQTLVEEWGYENVALELSHTNRYSLRRSIESHASSSARSSDRKKPAPTEQVEKALLDPQRKELLLQLAKRYEEKQFLPNVAAAREFLTMLGEFPGQIKDRDHSFRVLLRCLLQLPMERLRQITDSSLYSGPSQLGPISDAIAAAGQHLPRRSQEDPRRERHDQQKS
jgi:DNA-binding transcriptional ArsR family regulator